MYIQKDVEQTKKKHGIQSGRIIYTDLDKPAKPLFSRRNLITGKPDYIVKKEDCLIPVEVKSGDPYKPFNSHIFQIATYCQLIEDLYNISTPFGVLVYDQGKQYKIPFNQNLRTELQQTMNIMREMITTENIYRNHNEPHRCMHCSMKEYCKNRLI